MADDAPDVAFIDDHLARWDRFAQGDATLLPGIREESPRFRDELTTAMEVDPRRAAGRVVLYLVLQVGGSVPADSVIGRALAALVSAEGGAPLPVTMLKGDAMYFAGDLYFWWEAQRARFEPYPAYDAWRERPFTRKTVVPMYTAARAGAARAR